MNKINRIVSFLLLLTLTACGSIITITLPDKPQATVTQTPTATITPISTPQLITQARLNVRLQPSITASIVTVLELGTTHQVFYRDTTNSWLKIQSGWVSIQYVRLNVSLDTIPVFTQPTPTPTNTQAPVTSNRNRISYNVNGEGVVNYGYLQEVLTTNCKTVALIMNNLNMAVQIKQQCPNTIVISRSWSSLEGSEWFYRSPQNFVDEWNREGNKHIVRHSTNEPSFGGQQSILQFVNTEIELMRLARQNGFTLIVGNFSVGYFQPEHINNGAFDSYLRAINQYGHYLGLHEYSVAALPFGVGVWPVGDLLDRTRVQPQSWPLMQSIPLRYWGNDLPPYWYLRRGDWFLLRADTLGIQRPRIILTEFGWDNLPNIKNYIEPLRQQFGIDKYYDDMRGVNTYARLWAWYWPNWSFAKAACEQLLWANSIYPSDYVGFALFTWSNNPHWLQTDFSGIENGAMYELHDCLE